MYLQDTALRLGCNHTFGEASGLLSSLTGSSLSDKQIERLCHYYGEQLESAPGGGFTGKDDRLHYVMVDGSYVLTREQGWKEVKVGRIFASDNNYQVSDHRKVIQDSDYEAHLGSHHSFIDKFEGMVAQKSNLVFIADGATWIWNWIEDAYPDSVQILDFYHAYEKICQWIAKAFKEKPKRVLWQEYSKRLLLSDRIDELIEQIEQEDCENGSLKVRQALLGYLRNHQKRMLYASFQEKGYLIGSGAIESAQRTVVQHRLKRSGQRWTAKGAQQMLNLRTCFLAKKWERVKLMIRSQAA